MVIKESGENYLEAILAIKKEKGSVRSIDISNNLAVSKASVSVAMKAFKEEGYVEIDESGQITLTPKGVGVASRIYERHVIIARALIALGVSEKTANEDSCKIEHGLSDETFQKLKEHILLHVKKVM